MDAHEFYVAAACLLIYGDTIANHVATQVDTYTDCFSQVIGVIAQLAGNWRRENSVPWDLLFALNAVRCTCSGYRNARLMRRSQRSAMKMHLRYCHRELMYDINRRCNLLRSLIEQCRVDVGSVCHLDAFNRRYLINLIIGGQSPPIVAQWYSSFRIPLEITNTASVTTRIASYPIVRAHAIQIIRTASELSSETHPQSSRERLQRFLDDYLAQ